MSDYPIPDVATVCHIGGFTLTIYAFRKVTPDEARITAAKWLNNAHLSSFPKSGSGIAYTNFGFDE